MPVSLVTSVSHHESEAFEILECKPSGFAIRARFETSSCRLASRAGLSSRFHLFRVGEPVLREDDPYSDPLVKTKITLLLCTSKTASPEFAVKPQQ